MDHPSNPIDQLRAGRLTRRLLQLFAGLSLIGVANTLLIQSRLGLDPWNIFHQGLAQHTGLSIGAIIVIVGAIVLLTWVPMRQWPGVGTVANTIWIGIATDLALPYIPEIHGLPLRIAVMLAAIVLFGYAIACYIGSGLGPGPRDGLMTGLSTRTGRSIRFVRTGIELTILVAGWLLGGTIGVATVVFALGIGPITQFFLPRCTVQ